MEHKLHLTYRLIGLINAELFTFCIKIVQSLSLYIVLSLHLVVYAALHNTTLTTQIKPGPTSNSSGSIFVCRKSFNCLEIQG